MVTSNAHYHATKIPTSYVHEPVGSEEELFLESHVKTIKPVAPFAFQIFRDRFTHALFSHHVMFIHIR